MPRKRPEHFPTIIRDIVGLCADPRVRVKEHRIPFDNPRTANTRRWDFYRYMQACDRSDDTSLKEQVRIFRQTYGLRADGCELVIFPRNDAPWVQPFGAFVEKLQAEIASSDPRATSPLPAADPATAALHNLGFAVSAPTSGVASPKK